MDTSTRANAPVEQRTRDFLIPAGALVRGENLLAVHVFQHAVTSSDIVFSAALHADAPLPVERLVHFDPEPAIAHLEQWVPGLAAPLEDNWREQAECMQLATLGRWEEALEQCANLTPDSEEAATRQRAFQQAALIQLSRENEAVELFREAIPARDSSTPPELIDLTDHYNALVTEPWHLLSDGLGYEPVLKEFPTGTGTFDGIAFDARGIVQLTSSGIEGMNLLREFPESIDGIAVSQPVGKLHLLNATLLPDDIDDVVAKVVIHYDDGEEAEFPLRYWHETLAFMIGADSPPPSVRSGWRGVDPYRPGMFKELFIATWENPRPEVEVTSIDLRSESDADAALLVLGISVEAP